jgi:hypothetical protein
MNVLANATKILKNTANKLQNLFSINIAPYNDQQMWRITVPASLVKLNPRVKIFSQHSLPQYLNLLIHFLHSMSISNVSFNSIKQIQNQLQSQNSHPIKSTVYLCWFYHKDRYQEWHCKNKSEPNKNPTAKHKVEIPQNDETLLKFSGEECFRQFLDLFDVHRTLCLLPGKEHPNYVELLEMLRNMEFGIRFCAERSGRWEVVGVSAVKKNFVCRVVWSFLWYWGL